MFGCIVGRRYTFVAPVLTARRAGSALDGSISTMHQFGATALEGVMKVNVRAAPDATHSLTPVAAS
jgi:hypothetical protein